MVAAVINWIHKFKNKKIALFCDNMSVVYMINKNTSSNKNCMVLIRILVLFSLIHNVRVRAKHVPGKLNEISDWLSRNRIDKFEEKYGSKFATHRTPLSDLIWPMDQIWYDRRFGRN